MPNTSYGNSDFNEYYHFPLGICYVSAAMKRADGMTTFTLNLNQTGKDGEDAVAAAIREHDIDVVLTGGLCTLYPRIRSILESAKAADARVVTVAGGGIVSGDPEAAMAALAFADYGVIGEGEITVVELCAALRDGRDPSGVPGLIIKKGNGYETTAPRAEVQDLGQLPWCDYDGFGFDEYLSQKANLSYESHEKWQTSPALSMLTSRSCPHRCTFCFHPEGITYRQRDLDDVFAELDSLLARHRPRLLSFVDEMIGLSLPQLERFCERIATYRLPWTTSFRVSDITAGKVRLLKRSNCQAIFLGLESASDRILRSMRKGATAEQMERALATAAEERLLAQGNFIFGDPLETYESCMETLEWYLAHPQYSIALGPMEYYPGTAIYWQAVASGKIGDRVRYLRDNMMQVNCTRMTDEEYNDIIRVKIPEYKKKRYRLLPEILDAKACMTGEGLSLTGTCSHCGAELGFTKLSPIPTNDPLVCERCATLHASSALQNPDRLRNNIRTLLARYGKMAFWGIGVMFKNIMEPEMVSDPRIHLIDRKCGDMFGTRTLEPPETVARLGIEVVVTPPRISVFSFNGRDIPAEIANQARELGATRIIDLAELWYADISP